MSDKGSGDFFIIQCIKIVTKIIDRTNGCFAAVRRLQYYFVKRHSERMWDKTFHINKTLTIVCDAIGKAEENLREHIRIFYQNAGEEFITNLFYGQINYFLREASNKVRIEKAFRKYLENVLGYSQLDDYDLSRDLNNKAAGLARRRISCNCVRHTVI